MQKVDREHRASVRKNNRLNFQKRMQQRANMLGAMSLADRRAKDEQKRLEKEAYMAALKVNRDTVSTYMMLCLHYVYSMFICCIYRSAKEKSGTWLNIKNKFFIFVFI